VGCENAATSGLGAARVSTWGKYAANLGRIEKVLKIRPNIWGNRFMRIYKRKKSRHFFLFFFLEISKNCRNTKDVEFYQKLFGINFRKHILSKFRVQNKSFFLLLFFSFGQNFLVGQNFLFDQNYLFGQNFPFVNFCLINFFLLNQNITFC